MTILGFNLRLLPQNPMLHALWKEHTARGLFWVVDYVTTSPKWEACLLKTAMLLNIKVTYLDMCCGRCSKMVAIMTTILCKMQNISNDRSDIIHTSNLELKYSISIKVIKYIAYKESSWTLFLDQTLPAVRTLVLHLI